MRKTIIANPPLGIYKNQDINIGQAFYLVQLDVYARTRKDLMNQDIAFPTYSFNVYGKRGDLKQDPKKYAEDYRSRKSLRENLNLCSKERLSDDEPELIKGIKEDFLKLYRKGLILVLETGECFLDTEKIKNKISLGQLFQNVKMSTRTENALNRYWKENMTQPYPISKPTKFSISNPLEGKENIGPLFTISNLWYHKYKDAEFVMAGSERNLINYIFLGALCQTTLREDSQINQIFIYPQLRFKEGIENWSLEDLTEEEYGSDFLRYALMTPSLDGDGIANIDKSKLIEGRKFVYSLGNLGKVLTYDPQPSISKSDFVSSILSFSIQPQLSNLSKKLKSLSNRVRLSKIDERFCRDREIFSKEFSYIVNVSKVIVPKICKKIMENINGK